MRVLSTAISSVVTKTVHFFTIKKLDTLVILLAKIGYKKDIYKHRLLFCRLARRLIIRDESWNEIEIWRYPYFSNVWMLIWIHITQKIHLQLLAFKGMIISLHKNSVHYTEEEKS